MEKDDNKLSDLNELLKNKNAFPMVKQEDEDEFELFI